MAKFDMADCNDVRSLACSICCEFKERLMSMWNYRPNLIEGTTNMKMTTVREHVQQGMCSNGHAYMCLCNATLQEEADQ